MLYLFKRVTYYNLVPVTEGLPVPGAVLLVGDPLGQSEVGPGDVLGPLHLESALLAHSHIVTQSEI